MVTAYAEDHPRVDHPPFAFDIPTVPVSTRLVFAHYFPPFPRSFEDAPAATDYYATEYLKADGEGGKHRAIGGWLRDRPLPRAPGAKNWRVADALWEVRTAKSLGLDGFMVDVLTTEGDLYDRVVALMQAAAHEGGFAIVPMPDMHGEFAEHPERLATTLAILAAESGVYRVPDGRLLVSAFDAQQQDSAWWKQQFAGLRAAGISCAFVPCVQHPETYAAGFLALPEVIGIGDWGVRSLVELSARGELASLAHQQQKQWMEPVSPQDYRPKELVVREASGTAAYRAMWQQARRMNADLVQIVSWNDFSESTHIAPAVGTGWTLAELTAYQAAWFHQGAAPTITHDRIHLIHRRQLRSAGPMERRAREVPSGSGVDVLEVLVYATASAQLVIECTDAEAPTIRAIPAGFSAISLPLAIGTPRARLRRNDRNVAAVTSQWPVVDQADEQDLTYRCTASDLAP